MLKLAVAVDEALVAAVQKLGLPSDLLVRPFDFATLGREAEPAIWDATGSGDAAVPDLSLTLGIVLPAAAAAAAHDGDAERVRELLPEYLREDGVFFLSRRSEKALPDWCWRRAGLVIEHLSREYARAHMSLAAYREQEQRLERSLALAEAAFVDFRKEPLKLALRMEPSGVYVRPPAPTADAQHLRVVIRQLVPVLLSNVVYVDLFLNRDGSALAGDARVVIKTAYSGTPLCDMRFPFSDIRPGWKRFFCTSNDLTLRQPLTIELTLDAAEPADIMPGLSNPSPITEDCASVVDAGSAGRPLAMQIWCGIAGIRYPRHINALAPLADTAVLPEETLSVPADVLAGATAYAIPRRDIDFAAVSYDAETQSLLVHPLGRAPTVAKVSGLRARNLKSVSALVQLRRFEARPTDCAILVFRTSDRPPRFDEARDGGNRAAQPAVNWLSLQGGEWGEVRCVLPEALSGDVDVYLMTRNHTDDFNLSWAFFRGLQLLCHA